MSEPHRLNDEQTDDSIIMLIYGASGVGKTAFLGTCGSRTLIINIGNGLTTLKSKWFREKFPNVNPIVRTISENPRVKTFEKNAVATMWDDITTAIDEELETHGNLFDTIAIDDVTALRRAAMNKALEVSAEFRGSRTLEKAKAIRAVVPSMGDYSVEMDMIEKFIAAYVDIAKSARKHLILTAHERLSFNKASRADEVPKLISVRPAFTGNTFPDSILGYFDEVWYFRMKGEGPSRRTEAITQPNGIYRAKTRHGGIIKDAVENPNFLEFVTAVKQYNATLTK